MKRRGKASSKPVKRRGHHASGQKPRKAPTRRVSAADPQEHIDRLRRERDEAHEQQTATSEILDVISRSPTNLQPVFDAIVQNAARLCDASNASVYQIEANQLRHVANHGGVSIVKLGETRPITEQSLSGKAVIVRRVIHIHDALTVADTELLDSREAIKRENIRTSLAIPLMRGDTLHGVMILRRDVVRDFTDKQIRLLKDFAAQAVIAIENARLLNELHDSLEQQTATSEVLKVISSSPGALEPVFNAMLQNATRICEASYGMSFLREGTGFRTTAIYNLPPALAEERQQVALIEPIPDDPLARVATTKQNIHISDARTETAYKKGFAPFVALVEDGGARTLLVTPLLREGALIGAFAIYRQEVRPFSDKQIDLVKDFATQAVIAIENTRLLNELRQRTDDLSESLEQQTATSKVLGVISSSAGELGPVFEVILENATRICEAKFGNLTLWEGDGFRAVAMHGEAAFAERRRQQPKIANHPGMPLTRLAAIKAVVHIPDFRLERVYMERHGPTVELVEIGGARTALAVPMLKDDELVGAIILYRTEVRPFTNKQIELVSNFAAQAVIAIENGRLLYELRQRTDDLSEALDQQTATSEVLKVISSSPGELMPVFDAMLENATRICEAKFGILFTYANGGFAPSVLRGVPEALESFLLNRGAFKPAPASPMEELVKTMSLVHVEDLEKEDPDHPAAKYANGRAYLAVPLIKDADLVGAFVIYRQEVRPFTDKQIKLVQSFAAQAVIAIENARLLNELRQRTDDLSKSLEDLRTTQDRLVQTEKLASLGQLTAGIAHEIKNPLNFVNNFSGVSIELIDELQATLGSMKADDKTVVEINELADTLRGNLDKVVQHGKRADAIVKNMLLHSRQGSAEHRPVDINALVEESLNLAYHGARAETQGFNITLERSLDPATGEADVFPQDITRVLLNLISNGFYAATRRKAEGNGGDGYEPTLAAATRNLGDSVEIRIRDNGTGIPPEVKEKMFNPVETDAIDQVLNRITLTTK